MLELRTFSPKHPEIWFIQAEAQFSIYGISSSFDKYFICVASLLGEHAVHIVDLIRNPPAGDPYQALKRRLIQVFGLSPYQRFEAFMALTLHANEEPSHFMERMLALVPEADKEPSFLLKGFFLSHLHPSIRAHLTLEDISDPRAFSAKADVLWRAARSFKGRV